MKQSKAIIVVENREALRVAASSARISTQQGTAMEMYEASRGDARDLKLIGDKTLGDVLTTLTSTEAAGKILDKEFGRTITVGQVLDALHTEEIVKAASGVQVNPQVTVGTVVDFLKNNEALAKQRDKTISRKITVGEILDLFGEENVKEFIQTKTAQAAYKAEYANTVENIVDNWIMLFFFIAAFAVLATVVLELIDKDKR